MSELKVHRFITTDELSPEANDGVLYYEKSEADKVTAEKDAEIARLDDLAHAHNIELLLKENLIVDLKKACNDKDDWCLHTLKELRHQKYKRCLAMAEACMHKRWRPDEGFDYARSTRHMNKWLEIAEKFKEAK